jgi:hypothetical protein
MHDASVNYSKVEQSATPTTSERKRNTGDESPKVAYHLAATNVSMLRFSGRWPEPKSENRKKKDIGAGQRPGFWNLSGVGCNQRLFFENWFTLIASNVLIFRFSRHWPRPTTFLNELM